MRQLTRARKLFLIGGATFLLANAVGMTIALQLDLYGEAMGGTARQTWFSPGTVLSAPVVFLIPYALFLALATRRGRAGVAGVAIITLQSLISELSLIPDWSSAQAALAQDIGVLPVICVGTIVTMNLVMITCGTLELVRSWRGRRRGAVAVPAV